MLTPLNRRRTRLLPGLFLLGCTLLSHDEVLPQTKVVTFPSKEVLDTITSQFWARPTYVNAVVVDKDPAGRVHFPVTLSAEGTRFYAPVNFRRASFNSGVRFIGSNFVAGADFSGSRYFLEKPDSGLFGFRFDSTRFNRAVAFREAEFHGSVFFQAAIFDSSVHFESAQFKISPEGGSTNEAFFQGSEFRGEADFSFAHFERKAFFSEARFLSAASFRGTTFSDGALFVGTRFSRLADFSDAVFIGPVRFDGSSFHSRANFSGTRFQGDVTILDLGLGTRLSFLGATFEKRVAFLGSLPDTLNFTNVKLLGELDLTSATAPISGKKCKVAIGRGGLNLKIPVGLIELWFPEEDSLTYDERLAVYENLLTKFQQAGWRYSYQEVDIQYKRFKNRNGDLLTGIGDTFTRIWWNYGYAPSLVFRWTFLLFGIFLVLNVLFFKQLERVYPMVDGTQSKDTGWMGMVRRFSQILLYTLIIFFGFKLDAQRLYKSAAHDKLLVVFYLAFMYVAGLFCVGFIVNIIFTK